MQPLHFAELTWWECKAYSVQGRQTVAHWPRVKLKQISCFFHVDSTGEARYILYIRQMPENYGNFHYYLPAAVCAGVLRPI